VPSSAAAAAAARHASVLSAVRAARRALHATGYDFADLTISRVKDPQLAKRLRLTVINPSSQVGFPVDGFGGKRSGDDSGGVWGRGLSRLYKLFTRLTQQCSEMTGGKRGREYVDDFAGIESV
jgi:hypothetical protein